MQLPHHSFTLPCHIFFLFTLPRPPTSTLFPYTTLFRSLRDCLRGCLQALKSNWAGARAGRKAGTKRSEEHTSELQSRQYLVCRLLLEKKKKERHSRRVWRTLGRRTIRRLARLQLR